MKIKLYLYKIEAEIKDDIEKTLKYFRDMNFPIEFDIKETDQGKEYSTQLMLNSPTEVSMYMYDRKYNDMPSYGLTFFLNQSKVGIWLACDKINDNVDYTWKAVTHEIMHATNYLLRIKGRTLYDNMDRTLVAGQWIPYYKNEEPYALDGNYARSWAMMKPYLSLLQPPKIDVVITRTASNNKQVTGRLVAKRNGITFECNTLELADNFNLSNISCIPKGVYDVWWTFSPRFLRYTYEIQKVPKRSGIRIHYANYYNQLNGCIALGSNLVDINKDGQLDTINSRKTVQSFEGIMQKKPFKLRIE